MRKNSWTPIPAGEQIFCGIGDDYGTRRDVGTSDYELLYTTEGRGRFGNISHSFSLTTAPGDLVLLRPGTTHDYGPDPSGGGRWQWVWIHFHAPEHWRELLDWPDESPGLMRLSPADPVMHQRLQSRVLDIERLARGGMPRRGAFAMNALEEVLLWCSTLHTRSQERRVDPRIQQVLDRLIHDLESPLSREDLARDVGLSVSRLSALFQQEVGTGVVQYRERIRLQRACQLLRATPQPIKHIASGVGFDNPFYFSLRFKAFTGLSPRDYRKKR